MWIISAASVAARSGSADRGARAAGCGLRAATSERGHACFWSLCALKRVCLLIWCVRMCVFVHAGRDENPLEWEDVAEPPYPPPLPRSLRTGTKRAHCINQAFDQLGFTVLLSVIDRPRIAHVSSAMFTHGKTLYYIMFFIFHVHRNRKWLAIFLCDCHLKYF